MSFFSIWKSLRVLQKTRIKIDIYTYLFFSYTYTLLFCFKIKSSCVGLHKLRARLRPLTYHARKRHYAYKKMRSRYWFLYVKIIWICQLVCLFFLPCARIILSCIISCKGHKLWKLSSVHWCYQQVTIENYFSPAHTDHYDLRKHERPLPERF